MKGGTVITLVIPASNKRMGIKRALTLKRVIVCDSADAVTRPDWKAVAANLYIGCNDAGTTIFGKLCDVRVEPLKKAGRVMEERATHGSACEVYRARAALALDAAVAREREDWMREAQKWIDAYPLSKWPEPPPNTTPEQERISADMGRHVGRCMVRFGRARDAKPGEPVGTDTNQPEGGE